MSLKYLCHDMEDFKKIQRPVLSHLIESKEFPIVIDIPDNGEGYIKLANAKAFPLKEYFNDDGYPLLDVRDTYIVHLRNNEDCYKLFKETESWSPFTFQSPLEFIQRPYFVVSKGLRCRWHFKVEDALEYVPWAPLITASELEFTGLETFNEISLEEVLRIG